MNLVHALYPYTLVAANTVIGWVFYAVLNVEFGILFISVGLLVFLSVVGRTALRTAQASQFTPGTVERQSTRR